MGLLDDFTEYARRSGRNLGGLFDYLGDTATANNQAVKAGGQATAALLGGAELTPEQRDALHASPAMGMGSDAGGGGAMALMYVGKGAKNVPQRALVNAQKALQKGMDPEDIRQKYGWFIDQTGDWKYEISDHRARLVQNPDGTFKLDHPEMRKAYPEMMSAMQYEKIPAKDKLDRETGLLGTYNNRKNTLSVNERVLDGSEQAKHGGDDTLDPLAVALHELQHGVQFKEGFSPGTNPNSSQVTYLGNQEWIPARNAAEAEHMAVVKARNDWFDAPENKGKTVEDYDKLHPDWDRQYRETKKNFGILTNYDHWAQRKYEAALGEVEARDTAQRRSLTPDQRKAAPPYKVNYTGQYGSVPPQEIWDVRDVNREMNGQFDPDMRLTGDQPEMRQLLDLTPEGRARRAEAQGYDLDRPLYHGSNADIDALRPSERGHFGPGVYASQQPGVAEAYGNAVYPVVTNAKLFDATPSFANRLKGEEAQALIDAMPEHHWKDAAAKRLAETGYIDRETMWNYLSGAAGKEGAQAILKERGFGGIDGIGDGAETVIFNPAQVRSRFANFDPTRTADPSLLAGVVPGGLLALGRDDDKPKHRTKRGLLGE